MVFFGAQPVQVCSMSFILTRLSCTRPGTHFALIPARRSPGAHFGPGWHVPALQAAGPGEK